MMRSTVNLERSLNFEVYLPIETCRERLHGLKQGSTVLQVDERVSVRTRYVDQNYYDFIVKLTLIGEKSSTNTTIYGKLRYDPATQITQVTGSIPRVNNQRMATAFLVCFFFSGCTIGISLVDSTLGCIVSLIMAGLMALIYWLSKRGDDIGTPRLLTIIEEALS